MLAFSTDELANRFRSDVVDALEGDTSSIDSQSLWSNYDIYGYMTEACDRLAKDTEAFYRVIQKPVVANDPLVVLPPIVHKIRTARLLTARVDLTPYNIDERVPSLVDDYGIYTTGTTSIFTSVGTPRSYVADYEPGKLRLVPIPAVNDTLEMQCVVTIGVPMSPGMPVPFRDPADQRLLITYMKSLAYKKQDADAQDLARAEKFEKEYEEKVVDRYWEYKRRRREPGVVKSDV